MTISIRDAATKLGLPRDQIKAEVGKILRCASHMFDGDTIDEDIFVLVREHLRPVAVVEALVADAQAFLRSLLVLKEMRATNTLVEVAVDMRNSYVEVAEALAGEVLLAAERLTQIDVLRRDMDKLRGELADLRAANDGAEYLKVYVPGRTESVGIVLRSAMPNVRDGGYSIGGDVLVDLSMEACRILCCDHLAPGDRVPPTSDAPSFLLCDQPKGHLQGGTGHSCPACRGRTVIQVASSGGGDGGPF